MRSRSVYRSMLVVVLALGWSGAGYADEMEGDAEPETPAVRAGEQSKLQRAARPIGLDEIVVRARKTEESAQSVPVALTAFNAQAIEDFHIRDISDLTARVPNLIFARHNFTPAAALIYLRGVGNSDVEKTQDQTVMVTVDGVPIGSQVAGTVDALDVEMIEVLRGPQGTLFGRNSIGGVINVRSARPTGEWGLEGRVTYGEYERADYELVMNFPALLNETLKFKVAWSDYRDDGYWDQDFFARGRGNNRDRTNMKAQVAWTPNESHEVRFFYDYTRDRSESSLNYQMYTRPGEFPPVKRESGLLEPWVGEGGCVGRVALSPALVGLPGFEEFDDGYNIGYGWCNDPNTPDFSSVDNNHFQELSLDVQGFGVTHEWTINDNYTLWSIYGYRDIDEDKTIDTDSTQSTIFEVTRPEEYTQSSFELRLDSTHMDGRLRATTGFFWWHNDYKASSSNRLLAQSLGIPFFDDESAAILSAVTGLPAAAFGRDSLFPGDPNEPNPRPIAGTTEPFFNVGGVGTFVPNVIPAATQGTQETHSYAFFGTYIFDITEQFSATIGGRWTYEKKAYRGCFWEAGFAQGAPTLCNMNDSERVSIAPLVQLPGEVRPKDKEGWREYTPLYGLDYQATDDLLVYGKYATGFRSGGYNGRNHQPTDYGPYAPETIKSWEFGFKSEWFDNRVRLNVAYFDNEYDDKQETIITLPEGNPGAGTITVIDNAGEATLKGIEVELVTRPVTGLTLGGTYSWLDSEYDEYVIQTPCPSLAIQALNHIECDAGTRIPVDKSDNAVGAAPKYQFSGYADYVYPVGPGDFRMNVAYRMSDGYPSTVTADPRADTDQIYEFDASIGYAWVNAAGKRYYLDLFIKNWNDALRSRWGGVYNPPLFGFNIANLRGEPRRWGVTLGFEF